MNTKCSKLAGTDNQTNDMRTTSTIHKLFPLPAGEGQGEGEFGKRPVRWFYTVLLSSLLAFQCLAQPQETWVAHYNGGFSNKTHTPLAMALDNAGNVYVAGSSQNNSNDNDYVVLKYAPSGTQLFAARYDSTNGANDTVKGFALSPNGNSHVTGTGGTVKFDANGTVAWTAAYSGNDVAADTNGNVYVTGFSTNDFATVKLTANGSNLWVRTYDAVGRRDESQKVAVDDAGNVYVAGWETWDPVWGYSQAAMLKYDTVGSPVWTNADYYNQLAFGGTAELIVDNQGDVLVAVNSTDARAAKITASGEGAWGQYMGTPPPILSEMVSDPTGNVYVAGGAYLSVKQASTNGQVVWGTYQFGSSVTPNGIALDSPLNVYVTGMSTNDSTGNDFATIKYDNDGHQLWVKRYNGPANGDDGAIAIAVASDGSIYVTGYSANTYGGSDITTIKYGVLTNVQKKTDGTIQLQFFGTPGLNYAFQGTTNFEFWDELGSSVADTNGIFEFLDTNAPFFPYRFYRWHFP